VPGSAARYPAPAVAALDATQNSTKAGIVSLIATKNLAARADVG
jgi:hypothetical protein